jgi:hypothetical protein
MRERFVHIALDTKLTARARGTQMERATIRARERVIGGTMMSSAVVFH